jgi:hypothetical protein
MMGIALIGATIVGVYAGLAECFSMTQSGRENVRATQILQDKTETIRLYTWEQLSNSIPSSFTAQFFPAGSPGQQGLTYTGTLSISDAPFSETYKTDMKLATVTLNWRSGTLNHQRQMTTLVSHYGLHNYIYRQ